MIVTAEEISKDFFKYLDLVQAGNLIVITKDEKEIARLTSKSSPQFLSDTLRGIIKGDDKYEDIREEYLKKKYGIDDGPGFQQNAAIFQMDSDPFDTNKDRTDVKE